MRSLPEVQDAKTCKEGVSSGNSCATFDVLGNYVYIHDGYVLVCCIKTYLNFGGKEIVV